MFGRRREIAALTDRLGRLEDQLQRVLTETRALRPLMTDAGKLAELADEVGTLSRNTATTAQGLQEVLAAAGVGRPRLRARLNRVYCAEATGYVAVYFRGGRTNKIRLLVGPTAPPEECIGEANTTNDINSYVGGIVRAGEYWTVEAKHESTSFGCVYTPLS